MSSPPTDAAPARPFFGRRVAAAAFVMAVLGWGLGFYGPPLFMQTVVETRGWPLAFVSAAVTLHFLAGAVVVANLPGLYLRFGLPRVTLAGSVVLALGVLGWSLARAEWQLALAAVLSGAGWVVLGAAGVNAVVSPWFVRTRPAALAFAYNGASVGGFVFSPLWVAAIALLGFPLAAALIGAGAVAVIAVLARTTIGVTPAALGQAPDGDAPARASATPPPNPAPAIGPAGLWRERRFLTLALGAALGLFAQIGLAMHLFSVLAPLVGQGLAALALTATTAAAIVGRTLVGVFVKPGVDRRLAAVAGYAMQIAGSGLLWAGAGGDVWLLTAGVLLFGLGFGNATSMPPLIAQVEFRAADVGRVVALVVAIGQAAYAFAPLVFGLGRTAAGDAVIFLVAGAVQAASVAAFLAGRRG
jgi:MFS family permease